MIAIFPEIAAAAAAGDVDRLAILVRRYFCDRETFAPKPDIGRLMINAGMDVKHLPMDTFGALLAKDERGAFTVTAVINERVVDEPQRRFLLAHMLGHFLLEVQPVIARGDWQVSGYREAQCPAKRYAQGSPGGMNEFDAKREGLADEFAAALLLPRGMVRRAFEQIKDAERTAAFFGVGLAVLTRRLADMGLAPNLPANFLDAERQIGGAAEAPSEPKPVVAPAEPAMPRSYAASTYGKTEKQTREAKSPSPVKPTAMAKTPAPAPAPAKRAPPTSGQGMDRLREIARKMDKGK
jgi:Zn-dependent peptidase ImmA (M78 family)